jgi:preprotein translocase subunit SecY
MNKGIRTALIIGGSFLAILIALPFILGAVIGPGIVTGAGE